jgi:hypothetical protein
MTVVNNAAVRKILRKSRGKVSVKIQIRIVQILRNLAIVSATIQCKMSLSQLDNNLHVSRPVHRLCATLLFVPETLIIFALATGDMKKGVHAPHRNWLLVPYIRSNARVRGIDARSSTGVAYMER